MNLKIKLIDEIASSDIQSVGGKAKSLASLAHVGVQIPFTACLGTDFYRFFIESENLKEKISFEIGRKDFSEMRWEEIWDCSLRIRNFFIRNDLPKTMEKELVNFLEKHFKGKKVALRSSAPAEDSSGSSFAGLHESYINISGTEEIIRHIKLVWASLWSDAALLYRNELGLDIMNSTMAVVIQEVVNADISGIAFSRNPQDETSGVIEAVLGLNQGLVDGVIEPDRWIIARKTGNIENFHIAPKDYYFITAENGLLKTEVPKIFHGKAVLEKERVKLVFNQVMQCEKHFSKPQDMEWSFYGKDIYVLQSRPITTLKNSEDDNRSWYLSLTRSFENLEELKSKIVDKLIPQMIDEAKSLDYDLSHKSEEELAEEIIMRKNIVDKWKKIYWDEFIPFAHGIRIFGQFYNDKIKPTDPYEFISLLQSTEMLSLERNRILNKMTEIIKKDSTLVSSLKKGVWPKLNQELIDLKDKFHSDFGTLDISIEDSSEINDKILCNTILEMSVGIIDSGDKTPAMEKLEDLFLAHFKGQERENAKSYLELGRCSYRLRDDDNIYLGRIEEQLSRAVSIGNKLIKNGNENFKLKDTLINLTENIPIHTTTEYIEKEEDESDRQIVGQPSSPGLVTGKARVILCNEDLKDFAKGEILVCDAIDPKMTFIAPLASGIVERRGGMLIHGAIIAREYGIACVTGIPNATDRIRTGDTVTVDGYLGIVTLGEPSDFLRNSKGMK